VANPTPEQIAAQLWHLALSSTGNEFIDAAEAAIYAAIRAAELAQAERDARVCERIQNTGYSLGPVNLVCARLIREAANEPSRNPVP